MEPKLQIELTTWLESLRANTEGAKAFVLEQAPDVVREIVILGRVQSVATMLASLAAIMIGLHLWRRFLPQIKNGFIEPEPLGFFGGLVIVMVIVFAATAFCIGAGIAVTPWFAPKLYVLQTIAGMLRK